MTLDDVTFVYEKNILSNDDGFVSSFTFPKRLNVSSLNKFVDNVYKLSSIKKNLSFINTSSSSEISSLVNNILKKEVDLKNYIDSSIDALSSISSKNQAERNVSLLSYFHQAANVLSHNSQGVKSLENAVLNNASRYFSSDTIRSSLYFVGDSLVVDQKLPAIETVTHYNSKRKLLLFATSCMLVGSFLTVYVQKKFPKIHDKQNTKTEIYQSKESNHNNTKPVAKYENQNISK